MYYFYCLFSNILSISWSTRICFSYFIWISEGEELPWTTFKMKGSFFSFFRFLQKKILDGQQLADFPNSLMSTNFLMDEWIWENIFGDSIYMFCCNLAGIALLLKKALGTTKLRVPYPQVLFAGCFGIEGLLDRAGGWEGMLVLNFSEVR